MTAPRTTPWPGFFTAAPEMQLSFTRSYTGSSISAQGTKLALLTQPRRLIYVEACFNLLPKYVSAAFGALADIEKKIKDTWRSIVNIVNPDRAEFQRLHDEIEAFKGSAQDGKLKELESKMSKLEGVTNDLKKEVEQIEKTRNTGATNSNVAALSERLVKIKQSLAVFDRNQILVETRGRKSK